MKKITAPDQNNAPPELLMPAYTNNNEEIICESDDIISAFFLPNDEGNEYNFSFWSNLSSCKA